MEKLHHAELVQYNTTQEDSDQPAGNVSHCSLMTEHATAEMADVELGLTNPDSASVHEQPEATATSTVDQGASTSEEQRARPSLYDEIRMQMGAAFFMFLMADVRDLAKKGELKGDPRFIENLINFPTDGFEFISIYKENKEVIQERIDSKERYEMYASLFEVPAEADSKTVEEYLRSVQFLFFADENAEEECVFGIAINHLLRHVTVAFRGSVTTKDFTQDAKAFFTPIRNPVAHAEEAKALVDPHLWSRMSDDVYVHLGFREYLYGEKKAFSMPQFVRKVQKATTTGVQSAVRGTSGIVTQTGGYVSRATNAVVPETVSKATGAVATAAYDTLVPGFMKKKGQDDEPGTSERVDDTSGTTSEAVEVEEGETSGGIQVTDETKKQYEIILEMTAAVLRENPGYQLKVCGHSLGGALATMFAFEAAATSDDFIPKPVTCVTTGAPKVGNLDYLHAFEALEEQKKIRYIRVANFRDMVPLSPPRQTYNCFAAMFCQHRRFRHVGLRLKLFPHVVYNGCAYGVSFVPDSECV